METIKERKQVYVLIFIISLLLFTYTTVRAHVLSITWDEAFSYADFVGNNITILKNYNTLSANNHLLNTWLAIHFVKWFGVSEFVLRLPSLLSHILFLFFSAKLVYNFKNNLVIICSFLIININPYMLDFFSLSRGYGLSLGLMMTSVYYLYSYIMKECNTNSAIKSILFGGLATLAHFVLLNYLLILFAVIAINLAYNLKQTKKPFIKNILLFIKKIFLATIILAGFLIVVIPITFKLKDAGALFYGGETSFWKDTISTITERCFYDLGYNYWFQRIAKGFVLLIFVGSGIFIVLKSIKKQLTPTLLFIASLFLLIIGIATSTIIQKHFLDSLYLIDRTALFFVVLFNILFVCFINELRFNKQKFTGWILYFSGMVVVIHFIIAFNLKYVVEWKPDAETKEMLMDLKKIETIDPNKNSISIGIPLSFLTSINFYRDIYNLTWINKVNNSETLNLLNDYFYLEPKQYLNLKWDSIEIIKKYPVTKNILAKRKYPPQLVTKCFENKLSFENDPENKLVIDNTVEYSQGISYIVNDSCSLTNSIISVKSTISADNNMLYNTYLVISLENKKGAYLWQPIYVKDYLKEQNTWVDINFTCIVPKETRAGDVFKTYIWNPDKHKLFMREMEFKWITYKF